MTTDIHAAAVKQAWGLVETMDTRPWVDQLLEWPVEAALASLTGDIAEAYQRPYRDHREQLAAAVAYAKRRIGVPLMEPAWPPYPYPPESVAWVSQLTSIAGTASVFRGKRALYLYGEAALQWLVDLTHVELRKEES